MSFHFTLDKIPNVIIINPVTDSRDLSFNGQCLAQSHSILRRSSRLTIPVICDRKRCDTLGGSTALRSTNG